MEQGESRAHITRAMVQALESLQGAGVSHIPRTKAGSHPEATRKGERSAQQMGRKSAVETVPPTAMRTVETPPAAPREEVPLRAPSSVPSAPASVLPGSSREEALAKLARRVAACTRCPVLVRNRKQTVFGVGNPNARLVFIGEAPGADENQQGRPFVGRAGQKLTEIIENAMKLRREDVYIMNILRCWPPGNRTPLPDEAASCREYLDSQLAIIQPEFICCLVHVPRKTF